MNSTPGASPTPIFLRRWTAATWLGIALLGTPTSSVADDRKDPKADCELAVSEFLTQRNHGDHTARLLSELAQALECSGRVEEALGATFMEITPDTTGKAGLVLVRIQLLRELGLNDVARQAEEELGIALTASESSPAKARGFHWAWDARPTLTGSVAWIDQFDQPHSAILPLRYSTLIDTSASSRNSQASGLPATDSIVLEGGSIQVASGLSWGGWSEAGGFSIGPSGSVALPDDSLGWRSSTGGLDMNILYAPIGSLSLLASLSGSRSWFKVESGPMPTQDEFVATLSPNWKVGNWSFGGPQSIRALRTNSAPWGWSGTHSASVGRAITPWLGLTMTGNGAWYHDPSAAADQELGLQAIVNRRNLTPGQLLFPAESPTLWRLDSLALQAQIAQLLLTTADPLVVPLARNQSWTQIGLGFGTTLGPWRDLTFGASASWNETNYLREQTGYFVSPVLAYYADSVTVLVVRDTASGQDYIVKSVSPHGSPELVPLFWKRHRRDQCWTVQTVLTWKPKTWLNLRASWAWTRNISNLEDYVDNASYVRNVVSLSSSVSW